MTTQVLRNPEVEKLGNPFSEAIEAIGEFLSMYKPGGAMEVNGKYQTDLPFASNPASARTSLTQRAILNG